jgi:hypothetical protein
MENPLSRREFIINSAIVAGAGVIAPGGLNRMFGPQEKSKNNRRGSGTDCRELRHPHRADIHPQHKKPLYEPLYPVCAGENYPIERA